jgi:PAS domain S-box-containing protein
VDRLAKGLPETRFVNRYRTASGSYRWLEWRAFPRGELIYAAARDLTERIEAEQALRESETRFRLMADNAADVIWLMDPASGRFTYVSPSAERLRGYTPAEILAQPVEAALTPESYRQVMRDLPARTAAFQAGEGAVTHVDEVDQPRRDGSIVQTEVTSSFITDAEGRIVQILGTSRDITERRQAEAEIRALNESLEARVAKRTAQLEEAVAELEAFSYSVSHDLRAPLRAINGYATILVQDHGDSIGDDGVGLCDRIVDNTRRMGQLIDDLLAFARLGRTTLSVEAVDMRALVDEVLAEVRDKGLVHLDIGPLAPAEGDPVLLRQVWLNLIDNAVKFSAGRATARVRVGCREEPGELVYTVRDNGVGFDMQYVDKLFEVFERLHAGSYRGSGIGLAIVRRIVEAHGGRVWAEGEPDAGATFFFALPASGPAAAPPD